MSRRLRGWIGLFLGAFVLVLGLGAWAVARAFRKQICQLPDGSTLTLISVTYGSQHRLVEAEW